jgi:hypothetical protein
MRFGFITVANDYYYRGAVDGVLANHRVFLSNKLFQLTNGVVQHGILKGHVIDPNTTWRSSAGDTGAQLLGLYEQEVCALLQHLSHDRPIFVDVGAADGYYGLGLVALDHFERSICFESDDRSRDALVQRAHALTIADRVQILGDARHDLPPLLAGGTAGGVIGGNLDLSKAVILCDIEGHEFDLFDEHFLALTRDAYIIVENHDFMRPERYAASEGLRQRAAHHFYISEVFTGPRDLRKIPLLADHWDDTDRWMLCSESRAKLASWFVLSPLDSTPLTAEAIEDIRNAYVQAL